MLEAIVPAFLYKKPISSGADIEDGVRLYYSRLDFASDFPSADTIVAPVAPITIESSTAAVFANSPLVASLDS
ncbi:hypothetical protein RIR_jg20184.t1 [Rhizophagus irregularis DAOM 181602=DAOM 197198]|nr:hypothetical protein RIR_jg20184.t1 [Rhizophagus irregularis DAOM 181602=DAOM 197198]